MHDEQRFLAGSLARPHRWHAHNEDDTDADAATDEQRVVFVFVGEFPSLAFGRQCDRIPREAVGDGVVG